MIELVDSLAVKYRPKQFKDIVGNERNIGIISGYFSQGKFVKSWLLSGLTGAGKTTLSRIMAMAVNCQGISGLEYEPCLTCESCKMALSGSHPDIKELNAGSEDGRVAGIESILETIKFKPRFNAKVIIVDEAHLMSNKAAQSILTVLEQPPQRVMWILATTDPSKLPQPILGRCAKLYFEYPELKDTAKRLLQIAKKEFDKATILKLKPFLIPIAESTHCQVRNALSIMESLANIILGNKKIEDSKLKTMFKSILMDAGDLDVLAIRYVTHMLNDSYGLPLSISSEVEQSRMDELVTIISRHVHYAATFFTYDFTPNLGLKEFYKVRRKFYGVNFQRFDEALNKMGERLLEKGLSKRQIIQKALFISSGLIAATEKLRTGVISKDQALLFGINQYVLYSKGLKQNEEDI